LDKTLFEQQDESFRNSVLGGAKRIVVAEAGVRMGWEGYAKKEDCFTLNDFGESGPAAKVAEHLGFTATALAEVLKR
jgi:transketolase